MWEDKVFVGLSSLSSTTEQRGYLAIVRVALIERAKKKSTRPQMSCFPQKIICIIQVSYFFFSCGIFILLLQEKPSMRYESLLRSCQPSVYHIKMGKSHYKVSFPMAQQVNLPACSSHSPLMLSIKQGSSEYWYQF